MFKKYRSPYPVSSLRKFFVCLFRKCLFFLIRHKEYKVSSDANRNCPLMPFSSCPLLPSSAGEATRTSLLRGTGPAPPLPCSSGETERGPGGIKVTKAMRPAKCVLSPRGEVLAHYSTVDPTHWPCQEGPVPQGQGPFLCLGQSAWPVFSGHLLDEPTRKRPITP